MRKKGVWILLLNCVLSTGAFAQAADLLKDSNGDGRVVYLGFGDSITFGVGDGAVPGESSSEIPFTDGSKGYLPRLGSLLGIQVINEGFPGERLSRQGMLRAPRVFASTEADVVGLLEGFNDANDFVDAESYQVNYQRVINVARATGKSTVLMTLPRSCCDHEHLNTSTPGYSERVRALGAFNELPVIELQKTWETSCGAGPACVLYNVPEGLHPNTRGYDAIAQTIAASFLDIDIFSKGGKGELASATGIPESEVVVEPLPGEK